ncbi:hypothetical protein CCAX7_60640 [Capsulimonas corticalis]|uniref:Uncharacterized protein n=1 Tax=Capsulimonas corticalis TaxID=2219043 RepID=A0A402CW20_9BACT|nr:hypothetical protein [Capsulimonas corticalis]BDI34013.1 hypothetical protein CCAX7_60640 [Capsulimonas corticalis]
MEKADINIAPPDVLIRYLAVFSRFFRESQKFLDAEDYGGILLTGHAANVLHHTPMNLSHYRGVKADWKERSSEFFGSWASRFRADGAPEYLLTIWDEIFTPMQDHAELGLHADLSNLDLAPPVVFDAFMALFLDACLSMRFLNNISSEPVEWQMPDASVIKDGERAIIASTQIARAFAPLPTALLHWSSFDPESFINHEEMIERTVLREWWARSIDQVRAAVTAASAEDAKKQTL